ncbi:mediator of DNA damage checkpoint protein 1-like [Episyrphus balteatus]|uniref:mediator of DNA damage checkpoint protein 1-like n=1 Tax=Episyrphus balteatus TaxID=286459 RepID=UPI002485A4C8|nr:mediator of DNA damage checkpoint protein 1-like [Episyrphus balteatus]
MEDIEYLEEYEDFILPKTLNYSQEYPPPPPTTPPNALDTELLIDKCNTLQTVSNDDNETNALITTSTTNKSNFIKILNTEVLSTPAQIQTFNNEPAITTPLTNETLQQSHFSYDRANASFLNRITQNSILQRLDKYKSIATVKPTVQKATVFNLSSIIPPPDSASATKVRILSNHELSGANRCAVGIEDDSFLDYALDKHVTDDFTLDFNLDTADISDICSDSLNLSDDYNEGVFSLDLLGGVGGDGKQNKELKRKVTRDESLEPDLKKSKNGSILFSTKSLSKNSDKKRNLNLLEKKKANSNASKKSKLVVKKNGKKFVFPDRSKFSLKHLNNTNNIEDEIPQTIIRAIPAPVPPPAIVPLVNNGDGAKKEENTGLKALPVAVATLSKSNHVEEVRKELQLSSMAITPISKISTLSKTNNVEEFRKELQLPSMPIGPINKINNVEEPRKEMVQQKSTPKMQLTSLIGPLSKSKNVDEPRKEQPSAPKILSPTLGALSKINSLFGSPQKEVVNNNDTSSNKMPLENIHNSSSGTTNNLSSNTDKKTEEKEKDIVIFSSPKIMKRISQPIDTEAQINQHNVTTTPIKSAGFKFSHFTLKSIKPPSKLKLKETTITKESILMEHSGREDENQKTLMEEAVKEDENMKSIPTSDCGKKDEKKIEENVTTNGKKQQIWESLVEPKEFSIRLSKNAVGKIMESMKKTEKETTTKLVQTNIEEKKDDEPTVPANDVRESSLVCAVTTTTEEKSEPKLPTIPPTTTTVSTEISETNNKCKKGKKEKTIHPIKSMPIIAESAEKEKSISSPIKKTTEKISSTQKDNSTKDDKSPPIAPNLDSALANEPTIKATPPPVCEDSSSTSDLDNNKKPDGRLYPSRKITRQTALKSKLNTQPKPVPIPKASPSSLQIKDPIIPKEKIMSPIKESTPTITTPEAALADACISNQQPAAIPMETKTPTESEIVEPKKELEDETIVLSPFKPTTNFLPNDDSFLNKIKLNESPDASINQYHSQFGGNESNSSKIQIFELPSYIVMKTKIITRKDLETNKNYIPAIVKQQQLDNESDNNVVVPESSETPSPVIKTERSEFNSVCARINALLEENANYLKFASGYERLSRMNDVLGDISLSVEDATCTLKFLQSYLSSYPKDKSIRTRGQQFIPIYDRQKKIIGYRKRTVHVKPSSRSGSVRRSSSKTPSSIQPTPSVSSNVSLTTMNVKRNVHIVENNTITNMDISATKIEPDLMDVGDSELILPDTSPTKDICIKNEEDLMV